MFKSWGELPRHESTNGHIVAVTDDIAEKSRKIRTKKRICHVKEQISTKLVFLDPDEKAKLTPCHLTQAFPDKAVTVTLPR